MTLSSFEFIQGSAECGEQNSEFQRMVLVFSASYFLYDTVAMIMEGLMDKAMMIHHPLSMFGLFLPLYENIQGNFVMQAIFLTEVSNPAMHIRHLLRLSGRLHTKAYEFIELCFISLYIYARFFAIGPIIYKTQICPSNHILIKLVCSALFFQSLFFIMQMYKTLKNRCEQVLARKNHQIKLNWFAPLDKLELEQLEGVYNSLKSQTCKNIGI